MRQLSSLAIMVGGSGEVTLAIAHDLRQVAQVGMRRRPRGDGDGCYWAYYSRVVADWLGEGV